MPSNRRIYKMIPDYFTSEAANEQMGMAGTSDTTGRTIAMPLRRWRGLLLLALLAWPLVTPTDAKPRTPGDDIAYQVMRDTGCRAYADFTVSMARFRAQGLSLEEVLDHTEAYDLAHGVTPYVQDAKMAAIVTVYTQPPRPPAQWRRGALDYCRTILFPARQR
jgi:hypothetical protein